MFSPPPNRTAATVAQKTQQRVGELACSVGQLRHWRSMAANLETPVRGLMLHAALQEVGAAVEAAVPSAAQPQSEPSTDSLFVANPQQQCSATTGTVPTPVHRGQCVICHEELQKGQRYTALPCAHAFHEDCLRTWLHRQASCPSCRAPIDIDICAAAKELCETVSLCRPSPRAVEGVLRLADRLTGSMLHHMHRAAEEHNNSRDCHLVSLLQIDVIRNQVLGALPPLELWQLRSVSKAFRDFCQETLGDLPRVLVAGGIGGVSGSVVMRSVEHFEFRSMSWRPAAPMHSPRFDAAVCSLLPWNDGYGPETRERTTEGSGHRSHDMFVAGGASSFESCGMAIHRPDPRVSPLCLCGTAIASAELYCSASNSWSLTSPMPEPRIGARAVPVVIPVGSESGAESGVEQLQTQQRVLVIGGVTRPSLAPVVAPNGGLAAGPAPAVGPGRFLSSVVAYRCSSGQHSVDTADCASSSEWDRSLAPMRNRRADFGVSVLPNGQILVAGGCGFSGSGMDGSGGSEDAGDGVEDEDLNPWSALPIEEVEIYDVAQNVWTLVAGPTISREGCLLSSRPDSVGCIGVWGGVGNCPTRTEMEPDIPVLWHTSFSHGNGTAPAKRDANGDIVTPPYNPLKNFTLVETSGSGASAAAAWPLKLPRGCVGHAICTIHPPPRHQEQQQQSWTCPLVLGGMAESDQELQEGHSEQGVSAYIWSPAESRLSKATDIVRDGGDRVRPLDQAQEAGGRWVRLPNLRCERAAFACAPL